MKFSFTCFKKIEQDFTNRPADHYERGALIEKVSHSNVLLPKKKVP